MSISRPEQAVLVCGTHLLLFLLSLWGCLGMSAFFPGVTLGSGQRAQPARFFSVKSFGAKGDGVHDDTEAFRRAIAAAAKVGGTVIVDPVRGGQGYVLTGTLRVLPGVSIVGAPFGMPFVAWEGVPREKQTGAVILARPRKEDYAGARKAPLFELLGGNTVRGLYILYDQQPWPSDREFRDPRSPFHYPDLDTAKALFISEHVKPYGPTFYIRHGVASITIEDITCARYYDFCVFRTAGKVVVNRCYLFGYKRAFAIRRGPDTIRIRAIHLVPNVEGAIAREHSILHAVITAHDDNILFDLGAVDGYSIRDVTAYLVHTGFKLGADDQSPFYDPVENERKAFAWGRGPWGSIVNAKLDNVAIGFRCVVGTILPNQLTNIMVHVAIPDSKKVETTGGPVCRQAAFLVEPNFAGATLQVSNLSISSFAPRSTLASAKMIHEANGRAFLVDCPGLKGKVDYAFRDQTFLQVFGLVVSNILDRNLIGLTPGTKPSVYIRGFVHTGKLRPDGFLSEIVGCKRDTSSAPRRPDHR